MLIYLTPISICYKHSFIYDLLFVHPEGTIDDVEKSTHPLTFRKNRCNENFAKIPKKIILFGVLNSSTFAGLLGMRKTIRIERFMSVLDVKRKACLRNFRHVQRCAHAIACFIWRSLNYLYSLFESEIFCSLKNDKYIKEAIRSAMS